MKYQYFLAILISNCFGIDGLFFSSDDTAPMDCVWTDWVDDVCLFTSTGELRRRETRFQLPSRNGGLNCSGDNSKNDKPCTQAEYMSQAFMQSFTHSLPIYEEHGMAPIPGLLEKAPDTECQTSYTDNERKWKMSGRSCKGSFGRRRKRSIRFPLKFYHSRKQIRDVVFLIDESASVGVKNFMKTMSFVKETISKLCGHIVIGPSMTKVALTTFDSEVHDHFHFDDYTNKHDVLRKIDSIRYNSNTHGSTCLVEALRHVRKSVFSTENGARDMHHVHNLVILVTDGCANCAGNLKDEVRELNRNQISFMLVTVGDKSSCTAKIERLSTGNSCFLNYEMDDWDDFDKFVNAIKDAGNCLDSWKDASESCRPT